MSLPKVRDKRHPVSVYDVWYETDEAYVVEYDGQPLHLPKSDYEPVKAQGVEIPND